jgi:hypothetical protein
LTWKYLNWIGLNLDQFVFDRTASDPQIAVAQDQYEANTLEAFLTQEYCMNGRPLLFFGFQQLQQLVIEELAETR